MLTRRQVAYCRKLQLKCEINHLKSKKKKEQTFIKITDLGDLRDCKSIKSYN